MASEPPRPGETGGGSAGGADIDPVRLKNALKAFKKRLKLTRLDDESRLGHGAMTTGGRSGIVAITPPGQYPPEVWEALVAQGKLRKAGYGMFELAEEIER